MYKTQPNSVKSSSLIKIIAFLNNQRLIAGVWLLLVVVVALKHINTSSNNYQIFKHSFYHAVNHLNLYLSYPADHMDSNHYGPLFSLIIAPFALLPDFFGMLLWQLANVALLFFAIKKLPLGQSRINAVYWIITHELLTAMFSLQANISITAIIIFAFVFIERKQNFWAAFVIMLGTFVKLYGIVGLAFFFFVKQKPKFVMYLFFWSLVFLVLPMFVFGPQYILQCYHDWYISLSQKQALNASLTSMQDISVMGMTRRLLGNPNLPNIPFLISGLFLYLLPYLRISAYKDLNFRLLLLSSTLIFTVIFSNSSESPTYIIAFAGVAIWYVIQARKTAWHVLALFIFAILLTSLSPSDLFPKFIRESYIKPYSLKALPCILIWFFIVYQQIFSKFETKGVEA